ncbi:MAG TPA: tetratricopeptide repeat protein [Thermoanaerobaculia bacterium]|nr:tetratricopeptide repeat protein [Thermoanaerobaculia bacterium]
MRHPLWKLLASLTMLSIYYWALFGRVAAGPVSTGPMPAEEARRLSDRSKQFIEQGDDVRALVVTQRLHDAFPQNHVYLRRLADIYHRSRRPREEAQAWEDFMVSAPTPGEGCPQIGRAWQAAGDIGKSTAAFERCLSVNPGDADSILFLALAYEHSGQPDKARELYARGVALAPEYADLVVGSARMQLREGRYVEAAASMTKLLEKHPQMVDALLVAGIALRREGNFDGARRYLTKGVELSPGYADFYWQLAEIAEREHDTTAALRYYDKLAELKPDDAEIEARRRRLRGTS